MRDCPTRESLDRFLAGVLDTDEEDDLGTHVDTCPACQGEIERQLGGTTPRRWPRVGPDDRAGGLDLRFLDRVRDSAPDQEWGSPLWGAAGPDNLCPSDPQAVRPREALGAVPGYEILGELGRGTMGVVYKARQLSLGRPTALKMIITGEHASLIDRTRFRGEAVAAGSLRHPNIVQVYETGEAGGLLYFSMEYMDGPTLKERLLGVPLHARTAALLIETLARAVAFAHRHGIVHRDLKPANILLEASDHPVGTMASTHEHAQPAGELARLGLVPKIADFGLAKRIGDSLGTRNGQLIGTPSYMAPEQLTGGASAVGPFGDIYALGCILYEALTGRPPFLDASVEALAVRVQREDPVPPRRLQPKCPRDLETVCLKCLEKDPERRYATASDLAGDLERFLADEPVRARRQSAAERLARWAARHRQVAASVAVIALLLVVSLVGTLLAAAHFRKMEHEQRRLAHRNGELAQENAAERRKAEVARDAARESQRAAELTLADMDTEHGLQAAEFGRDREAVLWFARAAEVAASDPARRGANQVRTLAWSRLVSRPVAALSHPGGTPLTLAFHPGGAHLLSTTAPFPGKTAVWDLRTEQPLTLPKDVTTAAWSPDGVGLAVGGPDGLTLYTFPGLTGAQRVPTRGTPTLLRFSPDGHRLAVATGPIVRVWDRRRGAFVAEGLAHPAPVLTLGFSPDGHRLVSAAEDGRFRVFAVAASGSEPELTGLHRQYGLRWTINAPVLDRTGTRLVTVTAPSVLTWWDFNGRARVVNFSLLGGEISHLEASPDGSLLAATVGGQGVAILDGTTGAPGPRLRRGQEGMLFSVFSPDGRTLVVGGADPQAQQWRLPAGTALGAPAVEATGFRAAAFSNDGRLLATTGYENQVRVWALPRPDPREFTVPTDEVVGRGTFSPDSQFLLARLRSRTARVYRVADGSPAGPALRPDGDLVEAAFTADARSVVTVSVTPEGKGMLDLWDWGTGRRRFPTQPAPGQPLSLDVSASGRAAVIGRGGLLLLFDLPTGRSVREWSCGPTAAPPEDVEVILSADGRTVVLAKDHYIRVWDGDTGRERFDPLHHVGLLFAALSPDGRLTASVGADSTLRLWSNATGAPLGPPVVHPSWVDGGVAFHPDGRHVVTACKDVTVRVWDVATGRLASPPIRPASIGAARFSPDGRALVTAGADGTVEVWDWRSGRRLLPPRKLPLTTDSASSRDRTVQISPDGRRLAVGGRPNLSVLSLDDLDPAGTASPEDLNAWAELISHHRVGKGGELDHLTGEEWLRLWRDRRRSTGDRPQWGDPAAGLPPRG